MHKASEVQTCPYLTVSLDKSCLNLLMMLAEEHSVLLSRRTAGDFTLILPSTLPRFYITLKTNRRNVPCECLYGIVNTHRTHLEVSLTQIQINLNRTEAVT